MLAINMDRIARVHETAFERASHAAFADDKAYVMAAITELRTKSLYRKESVNWYTLRDEMQRYYYDQGLENWRSKFVPALSGVIDDGGKHWAGALGMRFDLRHLLAESWFSEYTLKFAQQTTATNMAGIHDLIEVSLKDGWGADKLSRQMGMMFDQWAKGNINPDKWLTDRLPRYRTNMIARTETMRSLNAGNVALYNDWGVQQHEWLATIDGVTRPAHAAAHGQVVPIGQPFNVGGESVMQPGDGSPENSINCRCTTIPVIPEQGLDPEQAQQQADDIANIRIQDALEARRDDYVAARSKLADVQAGIDKDVAKLTAKQNDLEKQIDALTAKANGMVDSLSKPGISNEEYNAIKDQVQTHMKERAQLYDQFYKLAQDRADAQASISKRFFEQLSTGSEPELKLEYWSGGQRLLGKKMADAFEWFKGMVDGDVYNDLGRVNVKLNRSKTLREHAYSQISRIVIGPKTSVKTVIHEIGHVLEQNTEGWHDRAVEFLNYRTENEPLISMRQLTGNMAYDATEAAQPDNFFEPYIGKHYPNQRMTEVISMGVERMYYDPVGFARDDPQHFDLILGLFRGWL